ncbi:glycosyltransferase [Actinomadura monticuli]|uniref:Glycosyltransferase n=1 Tax=Actinomadura monticuli TaxID=3097367 RepID=A0ABV4QA47_9ACTN
MIALLPHAAYLSETSRMLEIHRALAARGAPVRLATHGGTYEHLIDVPYDVIPPHMDAERCARFVREGVGIGPYDQSVYSDEEIRAHALAEAEYFRTHGVRVAVTGFTLTALLSTRLAGVALVTEHQGIFVPPITGEYTADLPVHCDGFNRVAASLGVEGVPSLAALLMGDLALVPEIPEVAGVPASVLEAWTPGADPRYRPGTRLRYTGPLFAHLDLPVPPEVDAFLDAPGPVAYVALTSTDADLVRAVTAALPAVDGLRVLVAATVHDLGDLDSDRVLVGGILPSHEIMPRAALAVTAGGQGSVQTALASGTPLIALPLQPEQALNIAVAERLDAARTLAPDAVPGLPALAKEMLSTDVHRRAASRIRDLYRSADGPGRAAEAVIELHETTRAATAPA